MCKLSSHPGLLTWRYNGKIMYKNIIIIILTSYLYGCSDATPMKISQEYQNYVGVWQYRSEEISESLIKIDNMLLAINSDATAIYLKCEFDKTKTKNTSSSSRISVDFPAAVVTTIVDQNITLVQEFGWFGFENELEIIKAPYQEDGVWHTDIEGKKLTKLTNQEISIETNWECPGDDENEST